MQHGELRVQIVSQRSWRDWRRQDTTKEIIIKPTGALQPSRLINDVSDGLWQHDLCRDLGVAGIVVLGVVGLEDRVEWWD